MQNSKKGFTLIELLVVISIIALLSSIVITSLSSARNKAADTAVRQNLNGIKTSAQLYYELMGKYGSATGAYYEGNCITNGTMFRESTITGQARDVADTITVAIQKAADSGRGDKNCRIDALRTQYMIAVQLKSSANYWCIDDTGAGVEISALPATNVIRCQ
jgi:prepilin-type N-terminal cleavage/methylation domain-containing protein